MANTINEIKMTLKDGNLSGVNIFLGERMHVTRVYHYDDKVLVDSPGQPIRDAVELDGDNQLSLLNAVRCSGHTKMGDMDKWYLRREFHQ